MNNVAKHKLFADMPLNILLTSDVFLPLKDIYKLLNGTEYDMKLRIVQIGRGG